MYMIEVIPKLFKRQTEPRLITLLSPLLKQELRPSGIFIALGLMLTGD